MTLKTLKDIFDIEDHEDEVTIKLLKQEAIKWVKLSKKIKNPSTFGWEECFRGFFNITQEDLK